MELRGEDEAEDGGKEDEDADLIHHRAQLLLALGSTLLLQCLNGDHGLLGGELGADEDRPQRDDDQDRPGTDGEINGTHGHARKAVSLHKARELTRLLDGSGQGQNAAAGHADHHDREHILAAAVARVIAQGGQQRADDGVDHHRACNEVGEQDSQQDVAEVCRPEAATGHFHDSIAHAIHQRGAAEACGHHKHGSHQQGVDIGEAGQCTACINASGKVKCCQRDHGSEPHGDLVQHIADQRCRKDHHTDDHLSIHNVSLSIHVLFLKSSLAARAGSFVDNILTKNSSSVVAKCLRVLRRRSNFTFPFDNFSANDPIKKSKSFPCAFLPEHFLYSVHCAKSALQNLVQHFKSVVDTSDFIGYP